ncbi:MAG: hypothetical protein JJT81_19235 [Rubellimicrobium sp.]|nr:hypothetical protein [Rubellimicrobium sp.]
MDIILHCGAHRCATTSFQRLLEANRAALSAAKVAIWTPGRLRAGLFDGVILPPDRVTPGDDRRAARAAADIALERAWLRQAGISSLVLSEENLMGSVRLNLAAGLLYPDLADRVLRLRRALAGPWSRIGLSIRRYDQYWSSALSFALAAGRLPARRALPGALARQPRRWRDVIVDLARVAPEAEILVFPHELFAPRPDQQLSRLIARPLPFHPLGLGQRCNRSPDAGQLRAILSMRGKAACALGIPDESRPWMPFTATERQAMALTYAADIDWLAGGAGGLARLAPVTVDHIPKGERTALASVHLPVSEGYHHGTTRHLV